MNLNTAKAAAISGISQGKILKFCQSQDLKATRWAAPGSKVPRYIIRPADLLEFMCAGGFDPEVARDSFEREGVRV